MNIEHFLSETISTAVNSLFSLATTPADIILQKTKKEFEGDFTLVTFPYIKAAKLTPEKTGELIGEEILKANPDITKYNVVKGFLNFSLSTGFWLSEFKSISNDGRHGLKPAKSSGKQIMLEYSSPNTNKPLHLGHVRNNLLGYAVATILESQGHDVVKVNLVNDRGIHICKSMLAWLKFGKGETPTMSGLKGDHLVGKYYVEFDKAAKKQVEPILNAIHNRTFDLFNEKEQKDLITLLDKIETLKAILLKEINAVDHSKIASFGIKAEALSKSAGNGTTTWKSVLKCFDDEEYKDLDQKVKEQKQKELQKLLKPVIDLEDSLDEKNSEIKAMALTKTALMKEAQEMLLKWEASDKETIDLWKMMNNWVYDGFKVSYKKLGVDFDKTYYESNTYLLGKEVIQAGLEKSVFYKKENNSVAIDLTADKLDEKIVLRSDGTSVYITQDLGTAIERFKEYPKVSRMIYTVGNEQDYHFKVLFKILEKLGYDWAKECYHLSYGMVELPEGKMKSREGTVVDADDLMDGMVETARELTEASGKVADFPKEEKEELFNTIGMGALKYFILKVDPKKKMLFDPKESIDLHGNTGPFIQYAHARIRSILRDFKADTGNITISDHLHLHEKERELIRLIYDFPKVLTEAANTYNPAEVANYVYELAKLFNQFYNECSVLKEENKAVKEFRVKLIETTANIIKNGMLSLGIEVPERM
jgi:arginyl-tRNA synthetase